MEPFYEAHPELSDRATAELRQLERDEAECLFLSAEELAPRLPVLMERFTR